MNFLFFVLKYFRLKGYVCKNYERVYGSRRTSLDRGLISIKLEDFFSKIDVPAYGR
jgi:hypothetical protein